MCVCVYFRIFTTLPSKQTKREHFSSNTDASLESPLNEKASPVVEGGLRRFPSSSAPLVFTDAVLGVGASKRFQLPWQWIWGKQSHRPRSGLLVSRCGARRTSQQWDASLTGGGMPVWASWHGGCHRPPPLRQHGGVQSCGVPPFLSEDPGRSPSSGQSHRGPVAFKIFSWVFDMAAGGFRSTQSQFICHPPKARCPPRQFLKS